MAFRLHEAIVAGRAREVEALLAANADVAIRDASGWTPLHLAVRRGDEGIINALLRKGADALAMGRGGVTPLDLAFNQGNRKVMLPILSITASAGSRSSDGRTGLHWAAEKGDLKLAELLLHAGGDADARDAGGETPLHKAARQGNKELAHLLLANGANPDAASASGVTPLSWAALRGHAEVVRELVENGARTDSKNSQGKTARDYAMNGGNADILSYLDTIPARTAKPSLVAAAGDGRTEDVRSLVEVGSSLAEKDRHGATALHRAAEAGHKELVEMLLTKGADANLKDGKSRKALDYALAARKPQVAVLLMTAKDADISEMDLRDVAFAAACYSETNVVMAALRRGLSVNSRDKNGESLLHAAALSGDRILAGYLLSHGGEVDARDQGESTPLHFAAFSGDVVIARDLMKKGASASEPNSAGLTPLSYAVLGDQIDLVDLLVGSGMAIPEAERAPLFCVAIRHGRQSLVSRLLAQGVDPNGTSVDGVPFLLEACRHGNADAVGLLLTSGASISAKGRDGATALEVALQSCRQQVATLLLDRGADPFAASAENKPAFLCRPDLCIAAAKSADQAFGIWQEAKKRGMLKGGVTFDLLSRVAVERILREVETENKEDHLPQLEAIWQAARDSGSKTADVHRYNAYVRLRRYDRALESAQRIEDIKRQAECESKLSKRSAALEHGLSVVSQDEVKLRTWWRGILNAAQPTQAELRDILVPCCRFGSAAAQEVLLQMLKNAAADGPQGEFGKLCQVTYDIWPLEDLPRVLSEIVSGLRGKDSTGSAACVFLLRQIHPVTVSEDSASDPRSCLPDAARKSLVERLADADEKTDAQAFRTLVEKAEALQLLGRTDEAFRVFLDAARKAASARERDLLVGRALKARDRHLAGCERYAAFLHHQGDEGSGTTADAADDFRSLLGGGADDLVKGSAGSAPGDGGWEPLEKVLSQVRELLKQETIRAAGEANRLLSQGETDRARERYLVAAGVEYAMDWPSSAMDKLLATFPNEGGDATTACQAWLLDRGVKSFGTPEAIALEMAKCLQRKRDFRGALALVTPLTKAKGRVGEEALLAKGLCLLSLGEKEEAEKDFSVLTSRAQASEPRGRALFLLGWIKVQDQEYGTAREYLEKVVAEFPDSDSAEKARGLLARMKTVGP